jgi:hypothetical protein
VVAQLCLLVDAKVVVYGRLLISNSPLGPGEAR